MKDTKPDYGKFNWEDFIGECITEMSRPKSLGMIDLIYPLTIVKDRYHGVYSGGKFIAWNLHPEDIDADSNGDDIDSRCFWEDNEIPCGKGETITDAICNLYIAIQEKKKQKRQR